MTHHHVSFMAHSHSMAHHHHHSVTPSHHHHHHHHHSPRHHHHHHHHRREHNDVVIPIGILPIMTSVNASNLRPKPPVGEKSLLIPKEAGETSSWEAVETSFSKLFTFCSWLMALVFIVYIIILVAWFITQA